MKRIFTLLLITFFFLNAYSQTADVDIYISTDGGATYPATTHTGDLNVLAGQTIYLKISISEPSLNKELFATGDDKVFNLLIDNSATFAGTLDFTGSTSSISNIIDNTSTPTAVRKLLNIATPVVEDKIVLEGLEVTIPIDISSAKDYILQLQHNFIGTTTTETINLITFHYEKPILDITTTTTPTTTCIDKQVNCTLTTTPDLTYDILKVGSGDINIDVTDGIGYAPFSFDDKIRVKDKNNSNTYGTSEIFTINENFFKGISLSGYGGEPLCSSEQITLTVDKQSCDLDNFIYELQLDEVTLEPELYKVNYNSTITIEYAPISNCSLRVKATGPGATIVFYSAPLVINNFFELDKQYMLAQDIRLSASQDPHDMIGELIQLVPDAGSFVYSDTVVLSGKDYFQDPINSNDYRFGRFIFDYDNANTDAYSLFDPSAMGVTAGTETNEVLFEYGQYFYNTGNSKFCFETIRTDIVVDRNEIFVPSESFCSYDTKDYTVQIDVTDLPDITVASDQTSHCSYLGYKIKRLDDDVIPTLNSASSFTIRPSIWWDYKDVTAVEIIAVAHVDISNKAMNCPDPWDENHNGGGTGSSSYEVGDEVIYNDNLYECMILHTAERPGTGSDWDFIMHCDEGLIPYEIEVKSAEKESSVNDSKVYINECFTLGVTLWHPILQLPIYFVGDSVSYNSNIYKCIQNAYSSNLPTNTSYWDEVGSCLQTPVATLDFEYASAEFYVYKPRVDGTFTNLADTTFGVSNQEITLESNYDIIKVANGGASVDSIAPGVWNFTPENLLSSDKNIPENTILELTYSDDHGCLELGNFPVYVDEIYNPDFNIVLENINDRFCAVNEEIELKGNDFTIDTLLGFGVRYNAIDENYTFNPRKAIDSTIAEYKIPFNINLELRNNSYWYDTTYSVEVYPFPITDNYVAESACFGEATAFSGTPAFDNSSDDLTWEWDFGDLETISYTGPVNNTATIPAGTGNTTGTYTNPEHNYVLAGKYSAILKLTSEDGCLAQDTFNHTVGSYPKVDFTASGFIYNTVTHFSNLTTAAVFDTVVDYTWQFGTDTPISFPTPTPDEFDRLFPSYGVQNVTLTATSENGCTTTDSIKVPVFNIVTVTSSSTYEALFNITEDDWIPSQRYIEDENLPSGWKHNAVAEPFNNHPNTTGMIWQTGDPVDEITDENSWVESPCFDISGLNFPLLSLDIYQSVEEGRDGAALQYTINDGKTWNLLGDKDVGVNWYDTRGIVSNPGNQTVTTGVGWSFDVNEWKTARYTLDDLKQEIADSAASYVRFRVAYSSDAGNAPDVEAQGFAFDNFTLTTRSRVVMMEQFVNSAQDKTLQEDEEAWLDDFLVGRNAEVVDMRYHNFISHDIDPLFNINPPDISSRSMEYGATRSQLTMVDGIHRCLANSEVEARSYYKERTLTDISFDIDVNHEVSGENLLVTADITKLKDEFLNTVGSEKCVVRMAIVQHGYEYKSETYNNVVVELLPNGEGNVVASIPADFAKDESMTVKGTWTPNVTTIGNKFRLVVYVQGIWGVDEIHQVWFEDSIAVPQVTVAAPTESLKSGGGNSFTIYPSPVKEKLNINWYETLENPVRWKLVSMSGTVVKEGITPAGQMREEIDTYQLNKGIYLLLTEDLSSLEVEQRKILIIK